MEMKHDMQADNRISIGCWVYLFPFLQACEVWVCKPSNISKPRDSVQAPEIVVQDSFAVENFPMA